MRLWGANGTKYNIFAPLNQNHYWLAHLVFHEFILWAGQNMLLFKKISKVGQNHENT